MSEEQLAAFLVRLKDDNALQEKLKGIEDPDAFMALAQEAGFELNKDQMLSQAQALSELSELTDEELERAAGGNFLSYAGTLLFGCCGDVITANQNIKVPYFC